MISMKKLLVILCLFLFLISIPSVFAENGLIHEWKFDEGSGSIAYDSVGNMNCMLYNFTDGWVSGIYDSALEFNRTLEQYLNCGNDSSLNFGNNSFSIEMWFKPYDLTGDTYIFSKFANLGNGFYFISFYESEYEGYVLIFHTEDGELTNTDAFINITNLDVWYHIVMIKNIDNIKFYVNGSNVELTGYNNFTDFTGYIENQDDFLIGNAFIDETLFGNYYGIIDNFRIWNYSLNETEIENLYTYNQLNEPDCLGNETICIDNDLYICSDGLWQFSETCEFGCSEGNCLEEPTEQLNFMSLLPFIFSLGYVFLFLKSKFDNGKKLELKDYVYIIIAVFFGIALGTAIAGL